MMALVEDGKIGTVITKDMSRIGRNYLEVGMYTEITFPQNNVRFIAVNSGVDSANQQDNEFVPFVNIINVLFCFSTVFANGIKAHSIAKAPVTVSLRERRLQVLFLFRCCL
jgi:DNA invertase Pin-like site-specific DNA recombinase